MLRRPRYVLFRPPMPSIGLLRLAGGDRSPRKVRRRSDVSLQLPPPSVLCSWLLPTTIVTPERPVNDSVFGILPAEIVENIFVTLVSLPVGQDTPTTEDSLDDSQYDRRFRSNPNLAVSAVCRRWRSICLRCAMVWHRISPNDTDSRFPWTKLCIERSGSTCPLDISFSWTSSPSTCLPPYSSSIATVRDDGDAALSVMRLLLPHASRWRSFSASIANYSALLSVVQSIAHLATAPRLLCLQLVDFHASCLPQPAPFAGGWNEETQHNPSLERFLRSASKLRSVAMWNRANNITWPSAPCAVPSRLTSLSIASFRLPNLQRSMIATSASTLTELVLLLGHASALHQTHIPSAIELPALMRLALVAPDAAVSMHTDGNGHLPRLLTGALRMPSLQILEFHSCDRETVDRFVGAQRAPIVDAEIDGIKRIDHYLPVVRRLVLVNIRASVHPLRDNSLASAMYALPGVTDLILRFGIETRMPLNIHGTSPRAQNTYDVDVSSILSPDHSSSAYDILRERDGMTPLPRLTRLECEGVSLEHLAQVLKTRKKRGACALDALIVHLPPPLFQAPSRSTSEQSILGPVREEFGRKVKEKDYEAKIAQLVRELKVLCRTQGVRNHPPWFD